MCIFLCWTGKTAPAGRGSGLPVRYRLRPPGALCRAHRPTGMAILLSGVAGIIFAGAAPETALPLSPSPPVPRPVFVPGATCPLLPGQRLARRGRGFGGASWKARITLPHRNRSQVPGVSQPALPPAAPQEGNPGIWGILGYAGASLFAGQARTRAAGRLLLHLNRQGQGPGDKC